MLKQLRIDQSTYDEIRMSEFNNTVESQIQMEISRVKEMFPEFKQILSEDRILSQVEQKVNQMNGIHQKLRKLKRDIPKIYEIEAEQLKELKQKFTESKDQLKKKEYRCNSLQQKISSCHSFLFKKVGRTHNHTPNMDAEDQLLSLKGQLQLKRKQLERYKSMPKLEKSTNVENVKYAGIELQNQMICFCKEKKKCMFCGCQMNDTEVEEFVKKRQQAIKITEKKLSKMERQGDNSNYVDPDIMISQILKFLSEA